MLLAPNTNTPTQGIAANAVQRRLAASQMWGVVQRSYRLAAGASVYCTAGHGGVVAAMPDTPDTPQWERVKELLAQRSILDTYYHVNVGGRNRRFLLGSRYTVTGYLPHGSILIGEEDCDMPLVFLVLNALGVELSFGKGWSAMPLEERLAEARRTCERYHPELLAALDEATA